MPNKVKLETAAIAAATKHGLSSQDLKTLQEEAHGVYEYVAQDLPPDHKRSMTCDRDTIIEVVLDAGRLEQALRDGKRMSQTLAAFFERKVTYEDLIDLVGPAFPYEKYEVSGEPFD